MPRQREVVKRVRVVVSVRQRNRFPAVFVEVNGRRAGGIGLDEFPAGIEVERQPPVCE